MKKIGINKKGQVTVFIIVGIVIFAIAGVSFFLMSENFSFTDREINIPTQAMPVYDFVSLCIEQTLIDGVNILSRNGGYIDPLRGNRLDHRSHLSDVVVRGPNTLPYWYYYDMSSNQFRSKAPPLHKNEGPNSVEEQLENYVKSNVNFCLNDFRAFSEMYDIDIEYFDIEVLVTPDGFSVDGDIPLTISYDDGNVQNLREFFVSIPSEFMKVYSLARDISRTQSLTGFVERPVLELISSQSGVGRILPPFYEVETFRPGVGDMWFRDEVHNHILRNILPHISSIQIMFTRNFRIPITDAPFQTSFSEIVMQDIIDPMYDYTNFDVNFVFPASNPHIEVGSGAPIMRADEGASDLGGIFSLMLGAVVRRYRFNYELSYPVISRICDSTSFYGDGLCFYFSLEGNIRFNNAFLPSTINFGDVFGYTSGESQTVNPNDPGQYVDKTVEFNVRDRYTRAPIDNVQLFYSCGQEFFVDTIRIRDGSSRFSGKMPFCALGGRIILRAPGYHSVSRSWNNLFDNSFTELSIFEMDKIREIPVSVMKLPLFGFLHESDVLGPNDQVILSISKIKSNPSEDDFPMIQTYLFGNLTAGSGMDFADNMLLMLRESAEHINQDVLGYSAQTTLEAMIELENLDADNVNTISILELVPGQYRVSLTFVVHGDPAVHIPRERRRICTNGVKGPNEFCLVRLDQYTLPELNMPSWPVSEIEFEWEVTNEIYTTDAITFFVPDVPVPTNYKELEKSASTSINTNRFLPFMGAFND